MKSMINYRGHNFTVEWEMRPNDGTTPTESPEILGLWLVSPSANLVDFFDGLGEFQHAAVGANVGKHRPVLGEMAQLLPHHAESIPDKDPALGPMAGPRFRNRAHAKPDPRDHATLYEIIRSKQVTQDEINEMTHTELLREISEALENYYVNRHRA